MKKIKKKDILVLIFLIILIIVMIRAFIKSRANEVIEVTANFIDNSGLLSDEIINIEAFNEGESGYSITLPEVVNTKIAKKYIVTQKEIIDTEKLQTDDSQIEEESLNNKSVEMLPGEKIYLTQEELENLQTTLNVEYDTIENDKNDIQILYNKKLILKDDEDSEKLIISGYMPSDTAMQVNEVDTSNIDIENEMEQNYPNKTIIGNYDIKLISNEQEYIAKDYEQTLKIEIPIIEGSSQNCNVLEIQNETLKELTDISIETNKIEFTTQELKSYLILQENMPEVLNEEEAEVVNDTATTNEPTMAEDINNKISTYAVGGENTKFEIDDYESDKNYYLGLNYTEENSKENTGKYTESNLKEVTVNYYGYDYDLTEFTVPEEYNVTLNATAQRTATGSISTSQTGWGWNQTTYYSRTDTVTITVSGLDGLRQQYPNFKADSGWTFKAQIPNNNFSNYYYADGTSSANSGVSVSIGANTITVTGSDASSLLSNSDTCTFTFKITFRATNRNNINNTNFTTLTVNSFDTTITIGDYTPYGTISDTELQTLVSYKKCIPIDSNGNISIELIDNPFMNRPIGRGFNGWKTNNSKYANSISTNLNTFVQTLQTSANNIKDSSGNYVINLYPDWIEANVVFVSSSGSSTNSGRTPSSPIDNNWTNINSKLNSNIKTCTKASNREVNIVVLMQGTLAISGLTGPNTPYTLTSLYNGKNYGSTSTYLNTGSSNITLDSDLQLDYLYVYSSSSYTSPSGTTDGTNAVSPCIYGNMYNLRIGRGIVPTNSNNCTWAQIQGGYYNRSGSEYKLIIESGIYYTAQLYRASTNNNASTSTTANGIMVVGNDIDRKDNNNESLKMYNRIASRTNTATNNPYTQKDSNALVITMIVKSGTIGVDFFNKESTRDDSERNYAGIYIGGFGQTGYDKSDRYLLVEGGNIANVIGGLNIGSSDMYKTYMYIKDGNIINITGGAGYTHTYGDRIIQVTGGCIKYSISGGSNGVAANSSSNNGQLTGNSLIYVGGDANVGASYTTDTSGNKQITETDTNLLLYGVNAGSVCGGANGNENYAGQTDGSYIIIDGNAVVHNNVFGGGNYGIIGSASGGSGQGKPILTISNESSSFQTDKEYLISIDATGGNGFAASGTNATNEAFSTTVEPSNSAKWIFESAGNNQYYIKNAETGGYVYITNVSSYSEVIADATIVTNNKTAFSMSGTNSKKLSCQVSYRSNWGGTQTATIYLGYDYQGNWSASNNYYGDFTSDLYLLTYKLLPKEDDENDRATVVNINVLGGTVKNNIYGGANQNNIYGTVDIAMNNGNVNGVIYGGSNIKGTVSGSTLLNITGGRLGTESDQEILDYTSVDTLFGGGLGSETKVNGRSLVNIQDTSNNLNIYGNVYGGSSLGTISGNVNVNIKDSNTTVNTISITGYVFGGGKGNSTTPAIVTGDIKVNVDGCELESCSVFGGSNINGTIDGNIEVRIGENNKSTLNTVYGGGNQAGIDTNTKSVYVYLLKNANVTNAFNGGKSADLLSTGEDDTTRAIYLQGGIAEKIFGGSDSSGTVTSSHVYVENGNASNVYGGNNQGGTTIVSNLYINGGIISSVYGGGDKAETTTSNIITTGGTISYIFGGGNQAGVKTTNVQTKGGNIGFAFGGSNTSGDVNESHVTTNDATSTSSDEGVTMTVTTTASKTQSWQSTTYPTLAKISVVFKNNTSKTIETWNANIFAPESTLLNNYSQSDIQVNNGIYTLTEKNKYWGSNTISAGGTYSLEFEILSMQSVEGFSVGYGIEGKDSNGDSVNYTKSIIGNVYGGNNQGGTTTTTNVTINGGNVQDVYGGGNQAICNETNVNINGEVQKRVFGGGNQAGINTNTNVNVTDGSVADNVYGGGNEGTVTGNTYVRVKNSTLNNSLYAGGNGVSAIVYGNTNLIMEGKNNVTNNVFGGGNQAATGTESNNNSTSTVNIVGAVIGKNVYGGANTSVVYGTTQTNIGYDTVGDTSLEKENIEIGGTVFGGGEANAAGSEIYDFSFISVTKGINIQINGNGHTKLDIKGSIFGSGNASSTSGKSYIDIQNYGTADNPKSNISIQRANCATISNSAISLSGTTDRTNEYSSVFFSLSRVDQVKMKNNSILYLCNGANLLKKLDSMVDVNGTEETAKVTIDPDTGDVTEKNVDNRIYMLEGKNLNVATNEQATAYGQVHGMFFFGLFTNRINPSTSTGLYHEGYNNGDEITNAGTFSSNSYVMAQHTTDHDITIDGFYTNYNESGKIKINYVDTTPKDDVYYIWLVGEELDVTKFEVSLTASKYATLGTYELLLQGFSDPNLKFVLNGFSAGLANGISLVDPDEIKAIEPDDEKANSIYGLTMKTGNVGWQTKGQTEFLTKNGGSYTGKNDYSKDNSSSTPTLNLCFYHSENITTKQALGDVRIRLQVLKPIDDLNYELSYIDIIITLSSALYQNDFYEAAITPGQEFGLFTTTETTITSKSAFSTYYSLYVEDFSESKYAKEYQTYKRTLVSRDSDNLPYVFPENTKLTMLDMVTNKYYYYIVTAEDIANNKFEYNLEDFITMGSNDKKFNESAESDNYYNSEKDLIYENFIFHINFADSSLTDNIQNNSLLMELRDDDGQTLLGVLGIQRDNMVYTVYNDKDATIQLDGNLTPETLYLGKTLNLNVITKFTQTIVDSKTIYDTQYFDQKLGIKISIYDNNGNRLNIDSLFGVNFELDGKLYYPRVDGTTRICIADKVTDVLAKIKMNTSGNNTLATGDYVIEIESFGSPDGIYYGLTASDKINLNVRIINSAFGLKAVTMDTCKIIEKDTAMNANKTDTLVSVVKYSSKLSNPNIAVSLYRRDYTEEYSQNYTLVDFQDYTSENLVSTKREKEYVMAESNPMSTTTNYYKMKPNLMTGTYKLVYKLYDGDTYVGEAFDYIVIK